jgi:hypothetical protein
VVDGKITKDQACKKDNPRQIKTSFQEDNMVDGYWGQCLSILCSKCRRCR